ncbi:propanediol utilization protein PduV [Escherichia coli]|uniref:Propanediol utilization protein PduV n=1 Tax=Escherichia coli TaxID=562 RepID=A0A376KVM1_ECOLX|nr:propanediol utilization protein PduV [Escherichia coli]
MGENIHYQKTQAIVWSPTTIDTPGEYLENRSLYSALLVSACEADIIALVLNADAPWSPFSPGFTSSMNRPVIGVVNQSRFSQHGTNIFGEMLVTGSRSAQRVSNQCG